MSEEATDTSGPGDVGKMTHCAVTADLGVLSKLATCRLCTLGEGFTSAPHCQSSKPRGQ